MSEKLSTVRLYGNLAKICGMREVKLQVNSVAEIIKALICNFPEIKKELEREESAYTVMVGSDSTAEAELLYPYSKRQIVRIAPVVSGAGGDVFKIIVGAALIVATGGAAGIGLAGVGALSAGGSLALLGTALSTIGFGLLLGGVSSLFMSQPDAPRPAEATSNDPSFHFRGAVNTTAQGHPVAIGYGEMIVGSNVIGAGLTTAQS